MKEKILITPRSLSSTQAYGLRKLTDAGYDLIFPTPGLMPKEEDLLSTIPECVGWLAGIEPVTVRVIDAAKCLRVISRNGTGVDNLPIEHLKQKGIELHRAEASNAQSVAELALGLTFACFRNIVSSHNGVSAGHWPRIIGRELRGSTLAVIGLGAIGSRFSEMALSLGAYVNAYDPIASIDRITHPNLRRLSLHDSIKTADAISLHAPLPSNGRPILSSSEFELFKEGVVIINTARAGLVDKHLLRDALKSKKISCYATDVFETEPPDDLELSGFGDSIMTSHIGGFTKEATERTTEVAVHNLLKALSNVGN